MAFDYRSLVADPSQAVAAGLGTYGKLQQLQMQQQMMQQQQAQQQATQQQQQMMAAYDRGELTLEQMPLEMRARVAQLQKHINEGMDAEQQRQIKSMAFGALALKSMPSTQEKIKFLEERKGMLGSAGLGTKETDDILNLYKTGQTEIADREINRVVNLAQMTGVIKGDTPLDIEIKEMQLGKMRQAEAKATKEAQKLEKSEAAAEDLKRRTYAEIKELQSYKDLGRGLGIRGYAQSWIPGTRAGDIRAQIEKVKNFFGAEKIELLRGLGAMSEKELEMVKQSVGNLDPNMSEKAFRKELSKIEKIYADALGNGEDVTQETTTLSNLSDEDIMKQLGL